MIPPHLQQFTVPVPVLDKGFIRLVDVMGDDGAIVEAARVTTGKGRSTHQFRAGGLCALCDRPGMIGDGGYCLEGDRRNIRYMMRHGHSTPFEMCEIKLHVQCPMDVWRQWIRHRTASVNEYSTRYSEACEDVMETAPDAWRLQSTANRQGSSGLVTEWPEGYQVERNRGGVDVLLPNGCGAHLSDDNLATATPGEYLSMRERHAHQTVREVYDELQAFGVALEQGRKVLSLDTYTRAFWKVDLHNLLGFLRQRLDNHAQLEIRLFAQTIWQIVQAWCPLAAEAFVDYRLEAHTFSKQEVALLREVLRHNLSDGFWSHQGMFEEFKIQGREKVAFLKALGLES